MDLFFLPAFLLHTFFPSLCPSFLPPSIPPSPLPPSLFPRFLYIFLSFLPYLPSYMSSFFIAVCIYSGGSRGRHWCPPMRPNSFIFACVSAKKHPCQRSPPKGSSPPTRNPGSAANILLDGDEVRLVQKAHQRT